MQNLMNLTMSSLHIIMKSTKSNYSIMIRLKKLIVLSNLTIIIIRKEKHFYKETHLKQRAIIDELAKERDQLLREVQGNSDFQ